MRSLRTVVALFSTFIVMGCQTIAGAGSASRPDDSAFSSSVPTTSGAQASAMRAQNDTKAKDYSAAEMSGSRKKLILIGAVVVAIVIAAIVIGGGDGDSGRGY